MIRHANSSEIEKILFITKACAASLIAQNIYQWNEHYPNANSFEKDLKRNELYVLIDDTSKKIIGCITISLLKDIEYDAINWLTKDHKNYYIHRLAINQDHQQQGNAKKLMDFAEEFARQQKALSVRLDTFSLNTRNQRFYENRGYQQLGSILFPKQSEAPFYCFELPLNTI
ncbi:Predicted acetyltransferase [unidentified eubacterium SCB49]|nr:Predicted acetyltransferase [unidentified eubacterium SCB49]